MQEGIQWLDDHQEDPATAYTDYQKSMEDKIRPTMMKLYQDAAKDFAPGTETAGPSSGPTVEEVD